MRQLSTRNQMTWKFTTTCHHTAFNTEQRPYIIYTGTEMTNETFQRRKQTAYFTMFYVQKSIKNKYVTYQQTTTTE